MQLLELAPTQVTLPTLPTLPKTSETEKPLSQGKRNQLSLVWEVDANNKLSCRWVKG